MAIRNPLGEKMSDPVFTESFAFYDWLLDQGRDDEAAAVATATAARGCPPWRYSHRGGFGFGGGGSGGYLQEE